MEIAEDGRAAAECVFLAYRPVSPRHIFVLRTFLELLCPPWQREPLQHIIGSWDFRDLTNVEMARGVFIPRQETEELVDHAFGTLQTVSQSSSWPLLVFDIGTGTGVIAISLARLLQVAFPERPCHVLAIDPNPRAVHLARRNAKTFQVENAVSVIRARARDLTMAEAWKRLPPSMDGAFPQLIVSNPPYVPGNEWTTLDVEVRKYDPKAAVHGGNDGGTAVIEEILDASLKNHWVRRGAQLWMEVDPTHPAWLQERSPWSVTNNERKWSIDRAEEDVHGRLRFVHGILS